MNLPGPLPLESVKYELQLATHWAGCINIAAHQGANDIQLKALKCLSDFEFRLTKLRDPPAWITTVDRDGDVILRFIAVEVADLGYNVIHNIEVAIDMFGIMTTVDRISKRCEVFDPFQECARFGNDILMWVLNDSFFVPFTL